MTTRPTAPDPRPRWWSSHGWGNPILQRCRRARLRPQHLLSWGLVVFSLICFVFLVVLLPAVRRFDADLQLAAKATLVPLLLIQGALLFGAGTMAVATGIARERDRELIDYQRMTPMSPTAKIVGYLFGLPAREYFLFTLTLPFMAYVVWVGGVSVPTLLHFYAVFFTSVWVYHMTGLAAGMLSKKPWQSAAISVGAVVALYLVLPQLSWVGLTIFEYLTVRPTFYGVVLREIEQARPGFSHHAQRFLHRYDQVPFFNARLDPTLFALALQGLVLVTLFVVVRRRWIDPHWHPFSKRFGVLFMIGVVTLVVGSIWPLLRDATLFARLTERMDGEVRPYLLGVLLGLYLAITTAVTLFVTFIVTPSSHTSRNGFRRARKLGLSRTPMSWDAGPALPSVALLVGVALAGYAVIVAAAVRGESFFSPDVPWRWVVLPALIPVPAVLFFHGLAERFPPRGLLLTVFGLWALPIMAMIIIVASTENQIAAFYVGSVCPAWPAVLALIHLAEQAGSVQNPWQRILDDEIAAHVPIWVGLNLGLYTMLAFFAQSYRRRWMNAWRAGEAATDPATPRRA